MSFFIFSQLPTFFSQEKTKRNFVHKMWISEVPIVVANRQAGRILCSIDLLSHAVRPIAVMCLLQCRYKKNQTQLHHIQLLIFLKEFSLI